jgi:hypothetical protein
MEKNRYIILSLIGAAALMGAAPVWAAGTTVECHKEDLRDKSKMDKSHQITTYTSLFWEIAKKSIDQFPEPLKKEGFVIGDFHLNNLGLYFDSSDESTKIVFNDLDDSGYNYLVGDLIKYLVYLDTRDRAEAKGNKFNFSKVVDAYVKGLRRKLPSSMPEEVAHFQIPGKDEKSDRKVREEIQTITDKLVEKRESDAKEKQGDIPKNRMNIFKEMQTLPFLSQGYEILGKWFDVNDSGSSSGMERYLFIRKNNRTGKKQAVEFKQLKCSATRNVKEGSQDLKTNFDKVQEYIQEFPEFSLSSKSPLLDQEIVGIQVRVKDRDQDWVFLARIKQQNLMEKYNIEKLPMNRRQVYAEFFAQYLGYFHSQGSDQNYQTAVSETDSEGNKIIVKMAEKIGDEFFKTNSYK